MIMMSQNTVRRIHVKLLNACETSSNAFDQSI